MDEKIIAKAKKLLALAEQGIDGEKTTAERFLKKFMAKYGIEFADLVDTQRAEYRITIKSTKEHSTLFSQILRSLNDLSIGEYVFKNKKSLREVVCTKAQFIEIRLKYSIYSTALNAELEQIKSDVLTAFIVKNKIVRSIEEEPKTASMSFAQMERVLALMDGMDVIPVHQGIESK
jgi:hypothetical protein